MEGEEGIDRREGMNKQASSSSSSFPLWAVKCIKWTKFAECNAPTNRPNECAFLISSDD